MRVVLVWCGHRLREVSTWVGFMLIGIGNWGLSSTNQYVQMGINAAPQVGAFLVALSERRPAGT